MKTTKHSQGSDAQEPAANRAGKLRGTLPALLIVAAILLIPLFFVIRSVANPLAGQNPVTPSPLSAAAGLPPASAMSAREPPACTFPLAQLPATASAPEEYTFSEPKVVLTASDNLYSLIEWLPDNQRVLMTEDLISTREGESDKMLRQSIALYNPETGESEVYATRYHTDEPPAWQAELNAVVYPAMNFLGREPATNRLRFTRQVWVSRGDPQATQLLADNLPQFPLAVKPGGSEVAYVADKEIVKRDASLQNILAAPFDPVHWDYAKARRNELPVSYEMAWQPGTSLIFLHSEGGMQLGGGYTYVLDVDTGNVCELDLGGWAVQTRWSPNGRYLAIIRADISSYPMYKSDLVVVDAATGEEYALDVTLQGVKTKHLIDDLVWAPDNRHLLAIGSVFLPHNPGIPDSAALYLVDFMAGQSIGLLPTHKFYASAGEDNLAWSPNGSKLLIRCPTMDEDRVCLIDVQRTAGQ